MLAAVLVRSCLASGGNIVIRIKVIGPAVTVIATLTEKLEEHFNILLIKKKMHLSAGMVCTTLVPVGRTL